MAREAGGLMLFTRCRPALESREQGMHILRSHLRLRGEPVDGSRPPQPAAREFGVPRRQSLNVHGLSSPFGVLMVALCVLALALFVGSAPAKADEPCGCPKPGTQPGGAPILEVGSAIVYPGTTEFAVPIYLTSSEDALQHVEQLRQFIKAGTPEDGADAGYPGIARGGLRDLPAGLIMRLHAPEFEHLDGVTAEAVPFLPEYHRPGA